jgi:hypothetical protein
MALTGRAEAGTVRAMFAPARKAIDVGRLRDGDVGGLAFGIAVAGTAVLCAYALVSGHRDVAVALSFVPLVGAVVTRPAIPLIALGASIPVVTNLGGGEYSHGYKVAVSDVLIVLAAAGVVLTWLTARSEPLTVALRPVAPPVVQYGAAMLLLLAFHPGITEVAQTAQRFELFLLPLILGAFAALTSRHIQVLKAYVIASTVLAALWPINHLGLQHNPVGGFIGNAILLLVGVRELRRLAPCLLLLVPGLVLTVSRGAIAATAIGLVVILILQRARTRPTISRLVLVVLVGVGAFALAPSRLQTRLTTYSAGTATPGQYAIYIRHRYAEDADRIIAAHRWTGVGIGNYAAADSLISAYPVQDPHQVVLLHEAEGGYLFAGSFILLIGGVMFALIRMRDMDVAAAAAGVLMATAAHGLVDIYWVRGTPVLGWLLVGMVCGGFLRLRGESQRAAS